MKVWYKVKNNSLSFEVCDVEQGSVEVDKLEEIHLGDVAVIIVRLCAVKFCGKVGGGEGERTQEGRAKEEERLSLRKKKEKE